MPFLTTMKIKNIQNKNNIYNKLLQQQNTRNLNNYYVKYWSQIYPKGGIQKSAFKNSNCNNKNNINYKIIKIRNNNKFKILKF